MSVKLICVSHSSMMDFIHPAPDVEAAARGAFSDLAQEVAAYDPELIVVFAPDHFNGVFYDLMPPFCVGLRARCASDWDIGEGPLPEARQERRERVVSNDRLLAEGKGSARPLDPEWDCGLLDTFMRRSWIAAFACLAAAGAYRAKTRFYQPIKEWIAGMGMGSAETRVA